jgi:hypothetical protein
LTGLRQGIDQYREAGVTLPCVGAVPATDFEATLTAAVR